MCEAKQYKLALLQRTLLQRTFTYYKVPFSSLSFLSTSVCPLSPLCAGRAANKKKIKVYIIKKKKENRTQDHGAGPPEGPTKARGK